MWFGLILYRNIERSSCVRYALSCNERKFVCRKCIELAGRTCGEFNGWMVGSFCLKLPLIHCHRMKKKERKKKQTMVKMRSHWKCNKVSFCQNHNTLRKPRCGNILWLCSFLNSVHSSWANILFLCCAVFVSSTSIKTHRTNRENQSAIGHSCLLCLVTFHYWWKWASALNSAHTHTNTHMLKIHCIISTNSHVVTLKWWQRLFTYNAHTYV